MAVCQNLVPLVNIKIAGKWMFIPLKMVLIGIDPYPYLTEFQTEDETSCVCNDQAQKNGSSQFQCRFSVTNLFTRRGLDSPRNSTSAPIQVQIFSVYL